MRLFLITLSFGAAAFLGVGTANANDELIRLQRDAKQWVMPTGDYANTRYSQLKQITTDNVGKLQVAWTFSTGVLRGHEGGPLVIGDVMYVHGAFPNPVFALDLNNDGKILWKYQPQQDPKVITAMCCDTVNRGLAYAHNKVFLYQADTTVLALDAQSGKVVWSAKNGDPDKAETAVSAPMVVKDKVLIGISGDDFGVRGHLTAYDLETGRRVWRAYSAGPDEELLIDPQRTTELGKSVGENSSLKTWQDDRWKTGGGSPSGWISYDPQLNLIYYGTGIRSTFKDPGENKWSSTIWARDVDTGIAKWVYQMTPHDEPVYGGVNEMILVDQAVGSGARKTLVHFDANGLAYTVDRSNGELLVAEKYNPNVNWTSGVDMDKSSPSYGRPKVVARNSTENSGDINSRGICPAALGAKNESPAAYSLDTGLFYVPTNNTCTYATLSRPPPGETNLGNFIAWDAEAGKIVWSNKEEFSVWSGVLATAGGVVFYGTLEGYLKAVDAKTGKELYKFKTPSGIIGNVMTYEHGGKQYVAVLSGIGGQAGIAFASGATDPNGDLARLGNYTSLGGTLTVFGLPGELATSPSTPTERSDSEKRFQARALQGVYWNTFLTRGSETDARLNLDSTASYILFLDVSPYNYSQLRATNAAATGVSPAVQDYLAGAPEEPVEVKIRPIAVTPHIVIEDDPVKPMINRKQLISPRGDPDTLIENFRSGTMSVPAFSQQVSAGHVFFKIRLRDRASAGCAAIAFTIWDFHNNPIDHLIYTVPIDNGSTKSDCRSAGSAALKGGFATLLDPAFSIGPSNEQKSPIQAALHLFEIKTEGRKQSFAIFIDKSLYSAPKPNQPNSERGVYAWRLGHWLSDYIGDPQGLPLRIARAWEKADKRNASAYAEAADELARKIFLAEPSDQSRANAAKAALQALSQTHSSPVVMTRLIGAENQKLYIPLALLAADGNRRGLPKPITVLQPLPDERFGTQRCIGNWSFGVSSQTRGLDDPATRTTLGVLNSGQHEDGEKWLHTNEELRNYFSETSQDNAPSTAEGLVLLAHHDGQGIYIESDIDRLVAGELQRSFPHGSVALLASCATSSPTSDMDVLHRLNKNGVDGMIVSPFKVRLEYGARLALEFTEIVRKHRREHATPTLAQMFSEATSATTKYFGARPRKEHLKDMALEFIVVGDPYLRLCGP
jgi:PQQ-dependent dehydrogenase (methanol/ethanol family)